MPKTRLLAPLLAATAGGLVAQTAPESAPARALAISGAAVFDGRADAPHQGWTIVVQGDRIAAAGRDAVAPPGATAVDLRGRTVMPGMFDTHGHLFTVDGNTQFEAYPLLDLAAGVTTVFSPGEVDPEAAVAWREHQEQGLVVGARLLTAGPYFEHGQGDLPWLRGFDGADQALAQLELWKDRIDGIKMLNHLTEPEFVAVLERAHAHGLKVTGHLGSIHARRAAELGIDRLEHGIYEMGELSPYLVKSAADWRDKFRQLAALDMNGELVQGVLDAIVEHGVVLSATTASFESMLPEWEPVVEDWDSFLTPPKRRLARGQRERAKRMDEGYAADMRQALANQLTFLKQLHDRGGAIVTGTDPAGSVLTPGFAVHREVELLHRAGLTRAQALRAATAHAAQALGLGDRLGTIEAGKIADLVVVNGDPTEDLAALRRIEAVYQAGARHDPSALLAAAKGKIR